MRNQVPQRAAACWRLRLLSSVAIYAMAINTLAPFAAFAAARHRDNTTTPIKHVIVIIGENRTFDHLFATYKPVNKRESVLNLLSEGIVEAHGIPGPNYASATQFQAQDTSVYQLNPGVKIHTRPCRRHWPGADTTRRSAARRSRTAALPDVAEAMKIENGLPINYYPF